MIQKSKLIIGALIGAALFSSHSFALSITNKVKHNNEEKAIIVKYQACKTTDISSCGKVTDVLVHYNTSTPQLSFPDDVTSIYILKVSTLDGQLQQDPVGWQYAGWKNITFGNQGQKITITIQQ